MTDYFDKYIKYGAYHWDWYKTKPRYKKHVDRVTRWIKDEKVLDIGAGDGVITYALSATGIELDPTAVKLAQERGVNVIQGSAYSLPFDDEQFDAVFFGDTLEHLEFPEKAILEARRVLKEHLYIVSPAPGGVLETYEYENSKWTEDQMRTKVEALGFETLELFHKGNRHNSFVHGKFKKI